MINVFLADGFEEIEAVTSIDILRRGGVTVKTIGVMENTVTGAHDIPVICDMTLDEAVKNGITGGILLPGGRGVENLRAVPLIKEICVLAASRGELIASICAAPSLLAEYGLLEGKKATIYKGMEDGLSGAVVTPGMVVVDKNIITGNGPGAGMKFALEVLAVLRGEETAENVAGKLNL